MDGHDNDTNSGANSSDSAQGGIFSTPDLTVNAENVAQPTQGGDERKRVASIFANTDTGRQAQRLNDAMEAQTAPVTEDLIINNGPKKKRKWGVVVLVVMALVAVVGVVSLVLLSNNLTGQSQQSPATPLAAFEDYRQFLIDGSSGENAIDGDWLIFYFGDSGMNNQDMNKYANSVLEKFQSFLKTSDANKINLTTNIANYSYLLNLFIRTGNLKNLKQDLLEHFVDGGATSAYEYITMVSSPPQSSEKGSPAVIVNDMLKKYLEAELSLVEQYDGWKCIDGYSVSLECVYDNSAYSDTYTTTLQQQSKAYSGMTSYVKILRAPFSEMTDSILSELRG